MLKIISEYPNYAVSSKGYVKNIKTGRILKGSKDKDGYLYISLYNSGKKKKYLIHRLVAEAFIDNPENKPQVNHINEIKSDNKYDNLEWVTSQENVDHSNSKKVRGTNIKNGEEIIFKSTKEAEKNGFDNSHISKCCRGLYKQHKGYVWKYI